MTDKIKCRWPSCENDTDCMSGCKPAPPMTAPSIKEALELKPCPFCGGTGVICCDQGDDDFAVTCKSCGASSKFDDVKSKAVAAWNTRVTLQPSGDRREAIARIICYWDDPSTCHDNYCGGSCRAKTPDARFFKAADAILASGLVQDEAGIRADEREKCAKIALSNRRQEEWYRHADVKRVAPTRLIQLVIYNAIRSARNGSEE